MSRSRTGLFLGLIGSFLLGGCTPSSPPLPSIPAEPDKAFTTVTHELAAGKPHIVWEAMPASYQKELTGLVHTFAGKMDAELYDKGMTVASKAVGVLKTKKEYIIEMLLENPMFAAMKVKKEALESNWDGTMSVLETVLQSEISTIAKLKTVDVGSFLGTTGVKVMAQIEKLSKASEEDPYGKEFQVKMAGAKAELVKEEGDTATIKISTEGESPEEITLVKVEGKWLPEEMVEDWEEFLSEAKKGLEEMTPESMEQAKTQALPMLAAIETALDQLQKAESKEDFQKALGAVMASLPIPGMRAPGGPPGF